MAYLEKNGVMEIGVLYEKPFVHHHIHGVDGIFEKEEIRKNLFRIIEDINQNAECR